MKKSTKKGTGVRHLVNHPAAPPPSVLMGIARKGRCVAEGSALGMLSARIPEIASDRWHVGRSDHSTLAVLPDPSEEDLAAIERAVQRGSVSRFVCRENP